MKPDCYFSITLAKGKRARFRTIICQQGNRSNVQPNSALLTDAFCSLRCACGAAKRER